MPRKSSKTAHVLNLLTGTKDADTVSSEAETPSETAESTSSDEKKSRKKKTSAQTKTEKSAEPKAAPVLDSIKISEQEQTLPNEAADDTDINADTVSSVKNEISSEIIDEIHISKPVEEMAENVAEILLDDTSDEIPEESELPTIDPTFEKMRKISISSAPAPHSDEEKNTADASSSQSSESDAKIEHIPSAAFSGPFSYNAVQPEIIPTPMPKSAVASMLIAQRKAEEKKEADAAPAPEISEETSVYENEEMSLVNLTEKAAAKRIPDIMQKFNMCTCERCYYDVLALTLNSVPQKTVIIPKNDIERKIKEYELDATVDLVTAISKSCVHVKISPRH